MVSVTGLAALIAGASMINPDVRGQISGAVGGDTSQIAAMASHAIDAVHTFARAAGDNLPFLDNTPLVFFGILALVLTVTMARS